MAEVNRLGLALTGYLDYFPAERIQILGLGEHTYMRKHADPAVLDRIFSRRFPCLILCRSLEPSAATRAAAEKSQTPLISSALETGRLMTELTLYLEEALAPSTTLHGVLVDVYHLGVLILGDSGIGKSECALELVKRGHMLVADDRVEIKRMPGDRLIGSGDAILRHHMEVRGVGIIDLRNLFGIGSVLDSARVELVVVLEEWDPKRNYERVGLEERFRTILGVAVPEVSIPLRPGRNVAALVEAAAINQRLRMKGYHTAKELNDRLVEMMRESTPPT